MAEKTGTNTGARAALDLPYASKVTLPVRRSAIIHRQRLFESLAQAVTSRITTVSAPAGYGKTTLLLDFAQHWNEPLCWYSLDERDTDIATFLRYYVAACRAHFPEFGSEIVRALESGRELTSEQAVDLMVAAVESQPEPFVLVLDDFHFIEDGPHDLREIVEGWLYRLPPHCRVILSGRTQPQLSILPRMAARQEVETITPEEFSFRSDEVVQLYREALGKEIALDDAERLATLTEGWAGALVLLFPKTRGAYSGVSLEQLKGSDTLFRYIELEHFKPLPDDVQEFLMRSAVLRRLDGRWLRQLLGVTDIEEKLSFLEQRNLFLVQEKDESYRYHRLFRAFLVSYLRSRDPHRFTELNLKAAELMEQAEEWEEAVYHYIQAAAWGRVVAVTERVGWRLFEEGRWDTLADWLEAVPTEELSAQPRLILWKARILHYLNQVDRALALLAQAISSFEARKEWVALGEALVTRGMCLRVRGDYQESREALTRARSLLLQHDGPTSALTEARKELGITLGRAGEFAGALEELSGALDVYEAQGDAYNIAEVSEKIGVAYISLGRLSEAAPHLERARQRWPVLGNDERLVQTLNNLGMLYYLLGDYEQAESVFQKALEKARLEATPAAEIYLLACLGDIRKDRGELPEALALYRSALERGDLLEEAYIRIFIMDAIANTQLLDGDVSAAESWARRARAEAEERGGTYELGLCHVTMGLIERHRGRLKEAVLSLEEGAKQLKAATANRELAAAYFRLAGVYFSLKRKRLALDYLEMSARLVAELGYDHFLQVEAGRNPLLVQYAAANKIADGYFEQLLKVIRPMHTGAAAPVAAPHRSEQSDTATLRAFGFGNPRVELGGREITDLEWRSEKGKEMFFFFLCNRRPLRKEEILAALWPDMPEDKTTSAFHSNMYRLRKALYPEVIAKDSGRYILDPRGTFSFDVEQFQELLKRVDAAKGSAEAVELMEGAVALHKGQFAPDFYSEWAQTLRWQLEEQHMGLLASLATAYSQAREYKRSADVCQRILEVDEYNEAAWYRLMSNYIHSDQVEAAKFCYNRYIQVLAADELGDEVPEFDQLYREIVEAG